MLMKGFYSVLLMTSAEVNLEVVKVPMPKKV